MSMKWYGKEFESKLKREQLRRLQLATRFLRNYIVKQLGIKSPPPSLPNSYPHLVTGELRRSIATEVDANEMVGRVGHNKRYGKHLETKQRRFILGKALEDNRQALRRILTKKID